jgi:hypothetical protein
MRISRRPSQATSPFKTMSAGAQGRGTSAGAPSEVRKHGEMNEPEKSVAPQRSKHIRFEGLEDSHEDALGPSSSFDQPRGMTPRPRGTEHQLAEHAKQLELWGEHVEPETDRKELLTDLANRRVTFSVPDMPVLTLESDDEGPSSVPNRPLTPGPPRDGSADS